MIEKDIIPKLFEGAFQTHGCLNSKDDLAFFVRMDITEVLRDICELITKGVEERLFSKEALHDFHEIQEDMIDTLSFFIKQDPTRLEGEAQIFTNKLNKFLWGKTDE